MYIILNIPYASVNDKVRRAAERFLFKRVHGLYEGKLTQNAATELKATLKLMPQKSAENVVMYEFHTDNDVTVTVFGECNNALNII